ncbi:molybdopterin converting factor, subunits 1/2 [Trichinella spiralis]|uniref:molybdopterin converting factor, subunits 1/2 n=1 Tax=Trichinella spiralis TaxID=6334 RepID=UPI0001EFE153|nr:molybdopterin converting factor, subunits 1/2 [Trichinella spiralis]
MDKYSKITNVAFIVAVDGGVRVVWKRMIVGIMEKKDSGSKLIVQILFFAQARELTGLSSCSLELEKPLFHQSVRPMYGADLKALIVEKFPSLRPIASTLLIAVNSDYVRFDDEVHLFQGVEVAVIPPVSGG